MSFLCDTALPGSARLHVGGGIVAKNGRRILRGSQSHASLLSPLIQLVRDPVGAFGAVAGNNKDESDNGATSDCEADRKQVLYLRMRNAEKYEEWETAATELDTLEGNDEWKFEDESPEYDYVLVATRLKELDDARINCDVNRMLFLIRTSLTRGLGGMGDLRLYKHSHIGTKALIERYIDSAQKTMMALLDVSGKQKEKCSIEPRIIIEKLLAARQSFGRSALLLSGGGTFGMNHIGVVKSLWKARLLPRIISGASAGSIVSAVLCTKTDTEIPTVLEEFCYGDLAVFEKEGEGDGLMKKAARFLKYGALFDISHLVNVMRNLLGDITFQESYNRTRRILNITVSSASLYELPRLLNYVTAPNVMIWSAVCASCSVPFVFSTASLLAKDPKTGREVPWNPTPNAGWIDGSVDNDLPMTRLAEMFNVNHFVVSQVNPHVVPFLAKEEEVISAEAQEASAISASPTWIHNLAHLAKGEALHRLQVLSDIGVLPNYLTKVRSVINQRYSGDITIFPAISYAHFPRVLSNPTTEYMLQCMLTGERATWPKLSRIKNHVAIELAIDETIRQFRARVVFSPSQVDLRLNNLSRPLSQGFDYPSGAKTSRKTTRFESDTAPPTPLMSTFSRGATCTRVEESPLLVHQKKPYLPANPLWKYSKALEEQHSIPTLDVFSSSTNPDASGSTSDKDSSLDSDTSDFFSSPPNSPSSTLPTLWPSTRQVLFPSSSQPATPSATTSIHRYRHSSLMNLTKISDSKDPPSVGASTPELRYKRLFHPPGSTCLENLPIVPDTQSEVAKSIHSPANPVFPLHHTISLPESETVPHIITCQPDSFPDTSARGLNIPSPILSPSQSPPSAEVEKSGPTKTLPRKIGRQDKKDNDIERDRRSNRRTSGQGARLNLLLDISGTRGMLLRRKKSAKNMGAPN